MKSLAAVMPRLPPTGRGPVFGCRLSRWALNRTMTKIAAHLFVIGIVTAAGPASATAQTRADFPGLPAAAARMYACVKKPHPGELKWQQIPWLTDLREAIRLAKEEK